MANYAQGINYNGEGGEDKNRVDGKWDGVDTGHKGFDPNGQLIFSLKELIS